MGLDENIEQEIRIIGIIRIILTVPIILIIPIDEKIGWMTTMMRMRTMTTFINRELTFQLL